MVDNKKESFQLFHFMAVLSVSVSMLGAFTATFEFSYLLKMNRMNILFD